MQSKALNMMFGIFLEACASLSHPNSREGSQLQKKPLHSSSRSQPTFWKLCCHLQIIQLKTNTYSPLATAAPPDICALIRMACESFIAGARNVPRIVFFLWFPTCYCTKVRDSRRDAGKPVSPKKALQS